MHLGIGLLGDGSHPPDTIHPSGAQGTHLSKQLTPLEHVELIRQ